MTDRAAEYRELVAEHLDEWGARDARRIATAVVFWGYGLDDARFAVAALDGADWEELDRIAEEQRRLLEEDA